MLQPVSSVYSSNNCFYWANFTAYPRNCIGPADRRRFISYQTMNGVNVIKMSADRSLAEIASVVVKRIRHYKRQHSFSYLWTSSRAFIDLCYSHIQNWFIWFSKTSMKLIKVWFLLSQYCSIKIDHIYPLVFSNQVTM